MAIYESLTKFVANHFSNKKGEREKNLKISVLCK